MNNLIARIKLVKGGADYWHTIADKNVKRGIEDLNDIDVLLTSGIYAMADLGEESLSDLDDQELSSSTVLDLPITVLAAGKRVGATKTDLSELRLLADRLMKDLLKAIMTDPTLGSILRAPLAILSMRAVAEEGRIGVYTARIEFSARYRMQWANP